MAESERVVEFLRKKDLVFKKELGRGACGQTVLLYDDVIEEYFVCKKYSPLEDELRQQLFANFVREIKLLHLLYHRNVVRVFSYFLYPDKALGYILMEYVKGDNIAEYLNKHPEDINEVFSQALEGFAHLEDSRILHRDIRPHNVLVTDRGVLKIIDFGFGKQTFSDGDFGKSVTLNWWCNPPAEFRQATYDFRTEVYFVGKLFEKIIFENGIQHFKHEHLLSKMCSHDPDARARSFSELRREMLAGGISDIEFGSEELEAYRQFGESLSAVVSKIDAGAGYVDDVNDVQERLERVYKGMMLETYVTDRSAIVNCFITGRYWYRRNAIFPVITLKDFIRLLKACSKEKKNIVLSNIQTRLDMVQRSFDKDIPF